MQGQALQTTLVCMRAASYGLAANRGNAPQWSVKLQTREVSYLCQAVEDLCPRPLNALLDSCGFRFVFGSVCCGLKARQQTRSLTKRASMQDRSATNIVRMPLDCCAFAILHHMSLLLKCTSCALPAGGLSDAKCRFDQC